MIRSTRPETLLSFKQGGDGTEDYASPEYHFHSMEKKFVDQGHVQAAELARIAWEKNMPKHNEICMTLQKEAWGYKADSEHLGRDDILKALAHARNNRCNLLANVGPLADGSLHPDDIKNLKATGAFIRSEGWNAVDAFLSKPQASGEYAGAE